MAERARSAPGLRLARRLVPLAGIAFALPAGQAAAATIVVDSKADTTADAGACVLRDAIAAANTNAPVKGCAAGEPSSTDVIEFAGGVTGTIALQTALPSLSGQLEITGPGSGLLDVHRAAGAPAFRVITTNGVTTISGVTISNGLVQGTTTSGIGERFFGGGIRNTGTLTLDHVTVSGNRLEGTSNPGAGSIAVMGGGIASSNAAPLTVSHSRIVGNSASATATQSDPFTEVDASAVGGGVFASNPQIDVDHSTISGNTATAASSGGESSGGSRAAAFGGGLATGLAATGDSLTIERTTIDSNTVDSAHPGFSYVLPLDQAVGGGIVLGDGPIQVSVLGSTVAGNVADSRGGIDLGSGTNGSTKATIVGSTLAANSAASAANLGRPPAMGVIADLEDTIVAAPQGGGQSCGAGVVVSSGHNLEGPGPGGASTCSFGDQTDQPSADPQLGPLADNGGPTRTMALSPVSPALDVGTGATLSTDQRDLSRPADLANVPNGPSGGGADIGAFELQPGETLRRLTVGVKGAGSGSVTSSPAGIACGDSCGADFAYGTSVTLTGAPEARTEPVRWSGCDSVNASNQCVVGMTTARSITATFDASAVDPPDPPDTRITKTKVKSGKRKATISFAGAGGTGPLSFRCSLDGKPYRRCESPLRLKRLHPGRHTVRVEAVDAAGRIDPSPAAKRFKLRR